MGLFPRKNVEKFAQATTIHGISDLVLAESKITRYVWAACMIVSLALMIVQLVHETKKFRQNPTSFDIQPAHFDSWPNISFCTYYWVNLEAAQSIGLTPDEIYLLLLHFGLEDDNFLAAEEWDREASKKVRESLTNTLRSNGITDVEGVASKLSNELNQISLNSNTNEEIIHTLKDAQKTLYKTGMMCYKWTLPKHNTSRVKQDVLIEKTDEELYYYHMFTSRYLAFTDAQVIIADKQKVLLTNWVRNELSLFIGEAEKHILINRPANPCIAEGSNISKHTCEHDCEETFFNCGMNCTWCLFGDCGSNAKKLCEQPDFMETIYPASFEPMMRCKQERDHCKRLCESCIFWKYQYYMYASPHDALDETPEPFKLRIVFSVKPEVSKVVEHYLYTPSSFVASIGGILSLFLGASILSMIHVFFFFCWAGMNGKTETTTASNESSQARSDTYSRPIIDYRFEKLEARFGKLEQSFKDSSRK